MSFFNPFRSSQKATPTKASGQQGQPLELVKYDTASGKFSLGDKALQVLREVKGPVGVVAVCGRARQGKSFILNQLLGQSSGFQVSSTHKPCTKGLWMWSSPVERKNADGSRYHLVLLDTEGIDAYDQTGQYSTQIFCLAVLLSSLFVYNQMGGIDEAALDRLSLVTEMTKHIRVRADTAVGDNETDLSDFTPSFLWLLRDFYLTLEEDGRQLTAREYLEIALKSVEGDNRSVAAKNKIRESIKNLFPNRDCFSLVRPMSDESQLAKLETISPENMRPQFIDGMAKLTRLIFMRAQPKRVGNKIITGTLLAALACEYVEAINQGAVPTIATAWQGVAEAECRRAADLAEEAYRGSWEEPQSSMEKDMDRQHQASLRIAQQTFDKYAIGESEVKQASERTFMARLNASYSRYKQERMTHADSECRKMITAITQELTQMANMPSTGVEDLHAKLKEWEYTYDASRRTECASKWKLHADFIHATYQSIVMGVVQRKEQERQLTEEKARAEATRTSNQLQEAKAALQRAESALADLKKQLQQESSKSKAAESEVSNLSRQLSALQSEQARERSSLSKQSTVRETELRKGFEAQLASLQERLQNAQLESSQANTSVSQQLASAQRQVQTLEKECQALRERAESAENDRQTSTSHASKTAQEIADLQSKRQSLQEEVQALQIRISSEQAEKQSLASKVEALKEQLAQAGESKSGPVEMDEGYDTPEEDQTAHITPAKMTINQIKDWLTENGHEEKVWTLTNAKAKKTQFVDEMNNVLGRS